MIKIVLPGDPISKMRPRFSKFGTYDLQKPQKHAAKFQILSQINKNPLIPYPDGVAIDLEITFYFKVREGDKNLFDWGLLEHTSKPDIDNLEKFVLDCLPGIVYQDDRQVDRLISSKMYSEEPRTEILIVPKQPSCEDQVKEVLSLVPPSEISSMADILSCIAEWSSFNENPFRSQDGIDYEEVAYLILDLAEKHGENLKKINKKFPGLAKVLKEKMENK